MVRNHVESVMGFLRKDHRRRYEQLEDWSPTDPSSVSKRFLRYEAGRADEFRAWNLMRAPLVEVVDDTDGDRISCDQILGMTAVPTTVVVKIDLRAEKQDVLRQLRKIVGSVDRDFWVYGT